VVFNIQGAKIAKEDAKKTGEVNTEGEQGTKGAEQLIFEVVEWGIFITIIL
jgi:hypothetical protein